MKKRLFCQLFGHSLGEIKTVYCGGKKTYQCRTCRRCERRVPSDATSAATKESIDKTNNAIMNGARAKYGLPKVDFSS